MHVLVGAQVAFSTVLLVGALLIVRGITQAYDTNLGLQTNRLISLELAYSSGARGRAERLPDNVLDPARWNVPGVAAVAIASGAPLYASHAIGIVRDQAAPTSDPIDVLVLWVTGNFFEVMDIPLVQGQSFELNAAAGEPAVVISRALAERLWKGQGAAGRFIEGAQMDRPAQVVGVAEDTRYVDLWDSRPIVYRRVKLDDRLASEVLLRTTVPPLSLIAEVRQAWRSMSPDLRVSAVRSGDDYVRLATASQRTASQLFSVFAMIALLVASIGVYSSMAWFVERRRREIAIRMAIGGAPGTIAWGVVLRAGVIGAIGVVLGLGTAAVLAPQLASVSRTASPYDALAFGGTAVLLAAVCLVAVVAPAVRASRVDPAVVLRSE